MRMADRQRGQNHKLPYSLTEVCDVEKKNKRLKAQTYVKREKRVLGFGLDLRYYQI